MKSGRALKGPELSTGGRGSRRRWPLWPENPILKAASLAAAIRSMDREFLPPYLSLSPLPPPSVFYNLLLGFDWALVFMSSRHLFSRVGTLPAQPSRRVKRVRVESRDSRGGREQGPERRRSKKAKKAPPVHGDHQDKLQTAPPSCYWAELLRPSISAGFLLFSAFTEPIVDLLWSQQLEMGWPERLSTYKIS